jgi:hypothetical protein
MKVKPSIQEIVQIPNTLASLAVEAAELSRLLLESQGELSPELEEKLAVNESALLAKVDGYNFIIEEFEAQASIWKRRKDACAAQQKKFENQAERLKSRIKEAIRVMQRTEVAGTYYKFQLRKSAPKLVIDDEAKVPSTCKMIVQTTVVDKEKVKKALADGIEVPGAHIEENGSLFILENAEKV